MIKIGIDYYPEHWDETLWEPDLAKMAQLGVHVVRIGEFAWSRLEPRDGEFDFAWLDRVIAAIARHGMRVLLGTPTNCAPLWLYRKYPETLSCDAGGRRTPTGIRGHRCVESPVFRHYAGRIVTELARRYAGRPEIFAWQIDNELESNGCTCPACTEAFRTWLQKKYGSTQALNRAWGNEVWSGELDDWSEVTLVRNDRCRPEWYNPAYMLDRERFGAQSLTGYIQFQCSIIRSFDPGAVITTNACFGEKLPDFHQEFSVLDVAGYDNYPPVVFPEDPEAMYSNAFALDFVRGFKRKNFWILEQLSGPMGGWAPTTRALEPGMLESYALQAVAHGADLVSFFRWRTSCTGAEMFCYGLLDHNNRPNRRLAEFESFCRRVAALPDLDKTTTESSIAILYSAEQEFAFKNQFQSEGFAYWKQLRLFHNACVSLGVNVDILCETEPLDGYKVVIVPTHFITDPAVVQKLEIFAGNGGTVIVTNRSGVKDQNGNCLFGENLPTLFSDMCGCHVEECDAISETVQRIRTTKGGTYEVTGWCDLIALDTAKPWALYMDRFYTDIPAITRNAWGDGQVYYLGTIGKKALYQTLLVEIFQAQNIPFMETLPQGVEISTRTDGKNTYRFFFNNTMNGKTVMLPGTRLHLQPLETKILVNGKEWK